MLQIETNEPHIGSPDPVRVFGWARTTLLDYPGMVASTLFLPGCNYRCPYCHNPDLIRGSAHPLGAPYPLRDIFTYFSRYAGMLEGVCVTGGEPLLQAELATLCRGIKALGLRVKLDTNGSMPGRLERLLDANLLDYAAVDVKGPPFKIQSIARAEVPQEQIAAATEATVHLLKTSGIPFELRTTVVPGLLDSHDFHAIGQWMRGAPRFVLQQFRPGKTLDPLFEDLAPMPPDGVRALCRELEEAGYFQECCVRGLG